jgi:hypothetical protein
MAQRYCFIAIFWQGLLNRKLATCFVCGHARGPATNANMDFRFWREDATLKEQQNVQQANRPLPRPSRHSIRRYCTDASARTISLFGKPMSNLSGDEETRMEDHMNEVTDQAFVAVVKEEDLYIRPPRRLRRSNPCASSKPGAIQAYKNTAPEPCDIILLWDNRQHLHGVQGSSALPEAGSFIGQNVLSSCVDHYLFTSSPSWLFRIAAVVANDP